MKRYILFAGCNGVGKSTLYQTNDMFLDMPRVNMDEIVREFGSWKNQADVFKAGKIAISKISEYFKAGESFNQEVTLCGQSVWQNIKKAKELGYFVERRFKESIDNLKTAVNICDIVEIFDNTNVFQRVARFESGKCIFKVEHCPNWVP